MAVVLSLALLGPPRIALETEFALPTRKAMALLARLAMGGAAPRERLAALLWSEQPGDEARRNLRQELHRLQATPAGAWIEANAEALSLRAGVLTDVARFHAAVEARDFARAAALHRGPLLQDFEIRGAAGFMDWLAAEREAVARTWRLALSAQAAVAEAAGELACAATVLRALVDEEPLQEAHHRKLILLLQRLGKRDAALAQFEHLRSLLRSELALDPLPETTALARRIQSMPEAGPPAAAPPQPELHPPLIGREQARERLRAAAGKLAVIEGDAGVGKTRLAEEFAQSAGPLLRIKAREISRETPFYPVAEALLQAYREDTAWFERLDPVWQAEVARLLPSLADGPDRSELPAPEARGRFLEGLATALLTAAQGGSLLFDDLQWFDAASAELVAHVVRRAHRVRLLATTRGEDGSAPSMRAALEGLARDGLLDRVALAPLDEEQVLALVRALSGAAGAVAFSRRLHAATAGNPLFILESLRDLFGAGVLWREEGTWSTPFDEDTEDYHELPLSPSVREAVLRRIDRLGQGVRRLLEAACLAGDRFDAESIGACTALSEVESVDAVDVAQRSNLIAPAGRGYRFSHDLVRRSLDDALGTERRKLLHRRLAAALEEGAAAPAEVARHLEAAGRAREAIPFRVRSAEAAARVYEISEALAQYRLALDDGAAGAQAFRIHAARVDHLRNRGDRPGWEGALAAMQALEADLADDAASVELAVRRAVYFFETSQYAQALAVTEQTLQRLQGRIDPLDEAKLMLEMGAALKGLGRVVEAQTQLQEALQRFSGKLPLKHANAAFWLSVLALDQGELDAAEHWAQVAAQGSLQAGHRRGHAMSQWTIAEVALKRGDVARAIDLKEQSVAEAREIGSLSLQRELVDALALRLEQVGRVDEAEWWRRERAGL